MTQAQGLFLTLEGIDGAGKSSHIDALEALFKAQGGIPAPAHRPIHQNCGKLILQDTIGGRPKRAVPGRCRGDRKPNYSEY